MKKVYIILLLFFLVSCWNDKKLWLDIELNNQNVQTWNIIQTWTENKEIIKSQSWTLIESQTWTIKENEEKNKIVIKRKLIKKNNNIFINEEWKDDITLTTKATWKTECNLVNDEWTIYEYTIVIDNWDYWIVKRYEKHCWADWWNTTYFWISLSSNATDLVKIYDAPEFSELNIVINWNNLYLTILSPDTVDLEKDLVRWTILSTDLKKDWFNKEWKNWVKIIDLIKLLKSNKKEEVKVNDKYSNDFLIKKGYKLNQLGDIKEYYKIEKSDNWQPQNEGGLVSYKTIYIKGNKILDITWNDREWWATSWFISTITVFDWKNSYSISEDEYDYTVPVQPIFKIKNSSKLIVDNNLNTVKMVNKEQWINKVLWTRK